MPLPPQSVVEDSKADLLISGLFRNKESLNKFALSPDFVMDRVTDFASAGLRTLVMGARYCPPDEWARLKTNLDAARSKLDGRDEAIADAYKAIERNLVLVGCTGIEDKLQEGVPETLTALRSAGIQVGCQPVYLERGLSAYALRITASIDWDCIFKYRSENTLLGYLTHKLVDHDPRLHTDYFKRQL